MTPFPISVLLSSGTEATWSATAAEEPPWWITLRGDNDREWSADGVDLFEALQNLRRQTDEEDIRLCINGARVDAYPSGMMREMWGGQLVNILRSARGLRRLWNRPGPRNRVYIFDPAPCDRIGTVDEQEEFYLKWLGNRQ